MSFTDDGGWKYPSCPTWCWGHMDETIPQHHPDFDQFGKDSPVMVNKFDGHPAVVSLEDLPHPQVDFTPAQARTLADQLQRAADFAERANQAEMHGNVLSAFVLGLLASAGRQANRSAPAGTELAA
ncbi:MAG TPA: hypothetical protein VGX23_33590 [Actinocrinis sp.]|nr:hypothetical protein [Actinocrinis sp.]